MPRGITTKQEWEVKDIWVSASRTEDCMIKQVGRVLMGFEHGSVARWVALKGMSHLNIMYSLWQFLDTERWALLALYTCDGERGEVRKRRERQGTFRKKSQTRSI